MFVRTFNKDERIALIEFLESEGFKCTRNGADVREDVIASNLPLTINIMDKTIDRMGNITCAAAAAGAKIRKNAEDFYLLYSNYSLERKKNIF